SSSAYFLAVRQLIPNDSCISDMDKPLVFLKCLIQLISDIASILPDLHCVIVSTPITVEGLGAAGKSFFIICTDFKTVQDSALLRCKTLHFYFAIHRQSSNLSNITEYILVYSKTEEYEVNKIFLKIKQEKDFKNYPYIEEETGRRYGSFDFTQKGQGNSRFFNGKLLSPPKNKHWIWDQERIDEGLAKGLIVFT